MAAGHTHWPDRILLSGPRVARLLRFAGVFLGWFVVCAVIALPNAPVMALDWPLRSLFTPSIKSKDSGKSKKSAPIPADSKTAPKKAGAGNANVAAIPAVVFKIEVSQLNRLTRLEITSTRKIDVKAHVLDRPKRAIIDLPEVLFQVAKTRGTHKKGGRSSRLVKSFRFGLLSRGRSRIVADLAQPGVISKVSYFRVARLVHKVRIDLKRTGKSDFQAAAKKGRLMAAAALRAGLASKLKALRPAGLRKAGSLPVIVLDPGHGGIDGGANGGDNKIEKDIVFAFTKVLAKSLKKTARYKVFLTRNSDVFMTLSQRVRFARQANAQLFISIHADSLTEKWVRGATVYSASDRASDAHAARLAAKENKADENAGIVAVKPAPQVSDILHDLTRRETRAFSHIFANTLVSNWRKHARVNKNPHRSGNFMVLKAPDVPSVLLELGYLSNSIDAEKLSNPKWRAEMAGFVAAAIDRFFAGRVAKKAVGQSSKSGSAKSKRAKTQSRSTGG